MGKVFNDQIIKILCAKNLKRNMSEANMCSEGPHLRRGESYVVVLNQMQRNSLNERIANQNEEDPTNVAICKLRTCVSYSSSSTQGVEDSASSDQQQHQYRKYWDRTQNLSRRFSENIQTIGRIFMSNISLCDFLRENRFVRPDVEQERVIPPVFGPFVDECICATVDRLFYFVCLLMGLILRPLEEDD